ncbi:MAG: hypothetical protein IKS97_11195 [Fibrobacter sp.]|nr:hypothetical protein [Fibrobacter sp.]
MQRLSRKISFSPSVTLTVSPNLVRVITLDCAPLSGQHPFISHLESHDELLKKNGMAMLLDESEMAELLDENETAELLDEWISVLLDMESDVAMDDELSGVTSGIAGLDEEPSHAKNTSDMAARYAKIFFIIPPLFFFNLVLGISLLLLAGFFC